MRRVTRSWQLVAGCVLGVWLLLVVAALPATFELASVETTSFSSLLPVGAPSTVALGLLRRLPGGDRSEALLVWRSGPVGRSARAPSRLADAVARVEAAITRLRVAGVSGVGPTVTAPDGQVAVVPVSVGGGMSRATSAVDGLRQAESSVHVAGVVSGVTGPAAFEVDLLGSLAGVDSKLVIVTAALVGLLFIATYRSVVAWVLPLASVGVAEVLADASTWVIAHWVPVSGESTGLLTVLVFGVGTDYALLITSRYREELRGPKSALGDHHALVEAWRRTVPAISASAITVVAALACLLLAKTGVTHGFAVVGMVGVVVTAVVVLTAYPAMLALSGRGVFWPRVPRSAGSPGGSRGFWNVVARAVIRRPRMIWMGGVALLFAMAFGIFHLNTQITTVDDLPASAPSVRAMELLHGSLPEGITAPAVVVTRRPSEIARARRVAAALPGVYSVGTPLSASGVASFDVVFRAAPSGAAGLEPVVALRSALARARRTGALVGGESAQDVDSRSASVRDLLVVGPAVLAVALVVLVGLLKAVAGPVMMVATVAASYGAVLGAVSLLSSSLLGWPGIDPSVPLLSFVFLVALGVDYNIFLMARAREELIADRIRSGASHGLGGADDGVERAVAATGGVLTAAGLILAGTFCALLILPLLPIREIGLVVACGVLLDALFVRSIVLPAIVVDTGKGFWWPTRLPAANALHRADDEAGGDDPVGSSSHG